MEKGQWSQAYPVLISSSHEGQGQPPQLIYQVTQWAVDETLMVEVGGSCTLTTVLTVLPYQLYQSLWVRVVDQHFRVAICSFSLTAAWLIPVTGPRKSPVLLFFVTTFLSREWVICAPAAFLGRGSHFRFPLWNQTLFPVTCGHHCRHRKVPSKVGRVDIQMRCRSLRAAPQLLATEQLLWFEKHGVLRKCCCAKAPSFGAAAATVV